MAIAVHVGDVGTVLIKIITNSAGALDDISDIETIELITRHPDGTEATLVGSFFTDGTDSKVKFTSVALTWSKPGFWFEQVRLAKEGGNWRCVSEIRPVLPAL
jgi:hypothetical protein